MEAKNASGAACADLQTRVFLHPREAASWSKHPALVPAPAGRASMKEGICSGPVLQTDATGR